MTLVELLAWNKSIPLAEYKALLKKLESKKRACRKACETIQWEEDALEVLEDETGSDRWQQHEKKRRDAVMRVERLKVEIETLELALAKAQA